MGQYYYQLCCDTGKTLRELGEIRTNDPANYFFLEFALSEKNKRINEEMENRER